MVGISDIGLSWQELGKHEIDGWVRVQSHPSADLYIWNYTEQAQFRRYWNEYTLTCRGLITDSVGNIIARPWKKFFNLGEGYAEIDWNSPVEVTDKMDGSLGILYPGPEGYSIATRGSFDSDQARHATLVWKDKYEEKIEVSPDYTFLFEIVYPANRIVLNYGDMDDLVLLGAVNREFGYYIGPIEAQGLLGWNGPVTRVFQHRTLQDAFSDNDRHNAEGYVVRSGNKMVKLKQVDYIELHRVVTNLNERTVWDALGNGKTVAEICEPLPDEFHQFVQDTSDRLITELSQKMNEVLDEYLKVKLRIGYDKEFTRKEFAEAVKNSPNKAYLFKMLDGKPIDALVWDMLKPDAIRR